MPLILLSVSRPGSATDISFIQLTGRAADITFGQLTGECHLYFFRSVDRECHWYFFRSVNRRVPLILDSVSWPGCAADITSQADELHRVFSYYIWRRPKNMSDNIRKLPAHAILRRVWHAVLPSRYSIGISNRLAVIICHSEVTLDHFNAKHGVVLKCCRGGNRAFWEGTRVVCSLFWVVVKRIIETWTLLGKGKERK